MTGTLREAQASKIRALQIGKIHFLSESINRALAVLQLPKNLLRKLNDEAWELLCHVLVEGRRKPNEQMQQ